MSQSQSSCILSSLCKASIHLPDCVMLCTKSEQCDARSHFGVCPHSGRIVEPTGPAWDFTQPSRRLAPVWGGRIGAWCVWDYGNELEEADSIHSHPVRAIEALARLGHGKIVFWPFDMTLKEAVKWYDDERARMAAAEQDLESR